MTIIGIDQSMTGSGITIFKDNKYSYLLIESKRTKNTKNPSIDDTKRMVAIKDTIKRILIENKPELVAMEGLSYGSTGQAVFQMGGLSHMLRTVFIELDQKFIVVPPTTLKKYFTGKGNAKKIDMVSKAEELEIDIPYLKKYKDIKEKKMDDNVVDSAALCRMAQEWEKYADVIEKSWEI